MLKLFVAVFAANVLSFIVCDSMRQYIRRIHMQRNIRDREGVYQARRLTMQAARNNNANDSGDNDSAVEA